MSQSSDYHWDRLFSAIGKVVCQWSRLEADLADLLYQLNSTIAPDISRSAEAWCVHSYMAENMDLRALCGAIRAAVFHLEYDQDLGPDISPALKRIENELRNERNRIVHDEWKVGESGRVRRVRRGTKLARQPSSGEETLEIGLSQDFTSVGDIEAVAVQIQTERDHISSFIEKLEALQPR